MPTFTSSSSLPLRCCSETGFLLFCLAGSSFCQLFMSQLCLEMTHRQQEMGQEIGVQILASCLSPLNDGEQFYVPFLSLLERSSGKRQAWLSWRKDGVGANEGDDT